MRRTDERLAPNTIEALAPEWLLSLEARNLSAATVTLYAAALRKLAAFLAERGMPLRVGSIKREHVEAAYAA